MEEQPDGGAQLLVDVLLVEAEPVEHADEEAVLLLGVVLALVGAVGDAQLVERSPVPRHFGVERLLDGGAPLDLGLAALDLRHDAVDVLQLVAALPEHGAVLHHLCYGPGQKRLRPRSGTQCAKVPQSSPSTSYLCPLCPRQTSMIGRRCSPSPVTMGRIDRPGQKRLRPRSGSQCATVPQSSPSTSYPCPLCPWQAQGKSSKRIPPRAFCPRPPWRCSRCRRGRTFRWP